MSKKAKRIERLRHFGGRLVARFALIQKTLYIVVTLTLTPHILGGFPLQNLDCEIETRSSRS